MPSSSSASTDLPSRGDVLIVSDPTAKKGRFVVSIVPNPGQIRYETYERALLAAQRRATAGAGRVWFSTDGRRFSLVPPLDAAAVPKAEEAAHGE